MLLDQIYQAVPAGQGHKKAVAVRKHTVTEVRDAFDGQTASRTDFHGALMVGWWRFERPLSVSMQHRCSLKTIWFGSYFWKRQNYLILHTSKDLDAVLDTKKLFVF